MLVTHSFPAALTRSRVFQIRVGGRPLDVFEHSAGHWASFECDTAVEIEIAAGDTGADAAVVRPLRLGIRAAAAGGRLCFTLPGPQPLLIEFPGQPLLFLYALPPAPPAPEGDKVRRFAGGQVHEAGEIVLRDGETCWLEPGAVVRGCIRASRAAGIRIGGYGVLDGSAYWEGRGGMRRSILLDRCRDVRIGDLLMLGPTGWMLVLGACEGVDVNGVRQITDGYGSDGIDIVGSRRVRISDCCLRNGDDNIAVKSFIAQSDAGEPLPWDGTVGDVRVRGCMFYNTLGGSSMEIGYETRTDLIHDIRFEDIDVLGVHQFGSVFGIHNGDHATVEDVTWENIRVEHHYDKLVDFRNLFSRWNRDAERGRIRNITLRRIRAMQSFANAGYTLSVMAGFDAQHTVDGVRIEDFELGGRKVLDADALDLVTRHACNITFHG